MAMLWCDSFDFFPSADITLGRMSSIVGAVINSGTGRNSTDSLRITSNARYGLKGVNPASSTSITNFAFKPNAITGGVNATFFSVFDSSLGLIGVQLHHSGTGQIVASIRAVGNSLPGSFTSLTTLGTSAAGIVTAGVFTHFQVKIVHHASAGSVVVKADGVEILNISGVQTQLTSTSLTYGWDGICLGSSASSGNPTMDWDDFIICDGSGSVNNDFIGDCRVEAKVASSGDGTNADFAPSSGSDNGAMVDEANQDGDTTYNSTSTIGHKDTYNYAALSSTGSVRGVQITTVAKKSDAGTRSIAHVTRSGGADYDGSNIALSTSYRYQSSIRESDPNTSASWLVADIDAAEFGQKLTA